MATGGNVKNDINGDNDSFLLMSYLDEIDDRVEELRRNALSLLQEKESLLAVLSTLNEDRLKYSLTGDESYEILTNIEQLKSRCQNIEINITTSRTSEQENSYLSVNSLVSELENLCRQGELNTKTCMHQAQGYLNACVSDNIYHGSVDYKFQGMVLGCNLEDQKFVRQRLECLVKGQCHACMSEPNLKHPEQFNVNGTVEKDQNLNDQKIENCKHCNDAATSDSHCDELL